jgi:NAD(P)-dependent dehydrogenase (short-subunit alcohol dehydrogenase family)
MQLTDRVAVVTGAGSGIGKAAALLFAQEGARVAVISHTEDEIQQTASEIEKNGGKAIPLVADISVPEQVQAAMQRTIDRWGRLDVVYANAGINGVGRPSMS